MQTLLIVGNAVLDVVLDVDHYPAEDEEMRALARRLVAGGNAANTARVLAGLGHDVTLLASVAPDSEAEVLAGLLAVAGVDTSRLVRARAGQTPVSYILLNAANGSRTIVHQRELAELRLEDFQALPLAGYAWVHFEGRNVAETGRMLDHLRGSGFAGRVSLEVEKDRAGIDALLRRVDLVLLSRAFALVRGFGDAASLLAAMPAQAPGVAMTCTWGGEGAWVREVGGTLRHAPAQVPSRVVDTVGAGDVFNAGMIDALAAGASVAEALVQATRLAGRKVGMIGLEGLAR